MRATALFLSLTLFVPATLPADDLPVMPVKEAEQVEVLFRDGDGFETASGRLSRLDASALVLDDGGLTKRIDRDRVTRVSALRGTRPRGSRGAAIGGAIGLGAGITASITALVIGCGMEVEQDRYGSGDCDPDFSARPYLIGGAITTVALTALGAVLGSKMTTDNWVETSWKDVTIGLGPAPQGSVQVAVSRRF